RAVGPAYLDDRYAVPDTQLSALRGRRHPTHDLVTLLEFHPLHRQLVRYEPAFSRPGRDQGVVPEQFEPLAYRLPGHAVPPDELLLRGQPGAGRQLARLDLRAQVVRYPYVQGDV